MTKCPGWPETGPPWLDFEPAKRLDIFIGSQSPGNIVQGDRPEEIWGKQMQSDQ